MDLNKQTSRKWSKREIEDIIKFIMENPDFEKPTKEIFYNQLIQQTKLNTTWSVVYAKVRCMKRRYLHALCWGRRVGRNSKVLFENLMKIRNKILMMCPHFIELNFIFGKNDKRISLFFPETEYAEYKFRDHNLNENSTSNTISAEGSEITSDSEEDETVTESETETDTECEVMEIEGKLNNEAIMDPHKLFQSLEMMKQLIFQRADNMQRREQLHKKKLHFYKTHENQKLQALEKNLLSKLNWEEKDYELRKREIQLKENSAVDKIKNKYEINAGKGTGRANLRNYSFNRQFK